MALKLRSFW